MIAVIARHRDFRRYRLFWAVGGGAIGRALPRCGGWGCRLRFLSGLKEACFSVAVMLMGLISNLCRSRPCPSRCKSHRLLLWCRWGWRRRQRCVSVSDTDAKTNAMIHRAGWTSFVLGTGFMTAMALVILVNPRPVNRDLYPRRQRRKYRGSGFGAAIF